MTNLKIAFSQCSTIIKSEKNKFWCSHLQPSGLYSFEMVKFCPKTCRLKNEKHKFVNVRSKAESSRKSYGSFEAEHVLQQVAQPKVAESCRCGICGRSKLKKMLFLVQKCPKIQIFPKKIEAHIEARNFCLPFRTLYVY